MSNAPLNNDEYPMYFREKGKLLAFTAKDKMYKIEPIGSNHGSTGVTIDHYITRNMVIKHFPASRYAQKVAPEDFKKTLTNLFESYIDRIVH